MVCLGSKIFPGSSLYQGSVVISFVLYFLLLQLAKFQIITMKIYYKFEPAIREICCNTELLSILFTKAREKINKGHRSDKGTKPVLNDGVFSR